MPSISKNVDGSSFPSVIVDTVNTLSGRVQPHQPTLKGNLLRLMLASAKKSQTMAKPHIISARRNPTTYKICPALPPAISRVPVFGKIFTAAFPSCMMPKPPWPEGPSGRNTDTITLHGDSLCTVSRWKYVL